MNKYYKVNVSGMNPAYYADGEKAQKLVKTLRKFGIVEISMQKICRNKYAKDFFSGGYQQY